MSSKQKEKQKRKKLGEFLKTHEHTFSRVSLLKIKNNKKLGFHTSIPSLVCHYLKSKRKGYNRNQNIKYTTWPYTKHLIRSYLDFQDSQLQSSQLTTCEKQKTQKHTILKGKQKTKKTWRI